jgi:hypothetical protein
MHNRSLMTRFHSALSLLEELSPKREVVMLCLILAETMIIWILAGTLLAEHNLPYTPIPIMLIFGVLLFAYLIPHILAALRIWTPEYEIIMGLSLLASLLLILKVGAFPQHSILSLTWVHETTQALILRESEAIRHVWMLILFAAYAWWRGRNRAEASLETAYSMLRFGLIWLAAILIFTVMVASEEAAIFNHIDMALLGFMIFTLLAIVIARQPEDARSAAWNQGWIWLIVLVAPILAIVLTSISTIGIFDRQTLDLLLLLVSPVLWFLQVAVQAFVLTIALLAFVLISPFLWVLDRYGFSPLSRFPEINLAPGNITDAERYASSALNIENPVRYLIVGVILLGLIWVLIRFSFRRHKHWQEPSRQQTDSLIDWNTGASIIHRAATWITSKMRRTDRYPLPEGDEWVHTRRIRLTYRAFLRLTQRRGFARTADQTPNQFARALCEKCSELSQASEQITVRYNEARYSGRTLDVADAEEAEQALLDVRTRLSGFDGPLQK